MAEIAGSAGSLAVQPHRPTGSGLILASLMPLLQLPA